MHEMSLCESIIQIVEEQARCGGFRRVRRVFLEVGRLAGVDVDALRFGFDVVARGTAAQGAVLEIEQVEATARCLACGASVTVQARFDPCPLCEGFPLEIRGGDQLRVKSLEVE